MMQCAVCCCGSSTRAFHGLSNFFVIAKNFVIFVVHYSHTTFAYNANILTRLLVPSSTDKRYSSINLCRLLRIEYVEILPVHINA